MSDAQQTAPPQIRGGEATPVAVPRFELLPFAGMEAAAASLPRGAVVTVTCSPRHGLERTLAAAEWLQAAGYRAVPHLAARQVRDQRHLEGVATRLAAAGIEDTFVVGGDAPQPEGDYPGGLELLEALAALPLRPARLGIPAYPEGHPHFEAATLQRILDAKAQHADYVVTQLCFEAAPLVSWLEAQRCGGLRLPVYAGVPGVIARTQLMAMAVRLGIGPSTRALKRGRGWLGRLLRPARYRPDALLQALRPVLDGGPGFAGLHFYTFNRVAATREWLDRWQPAVSPPCRDADAAPQPEGAASAEPLG
ncbi:methylenetetrahydrofolate reductase [Halomonas sp. NO4]|uniref:methylenetetrahydrofolate reductase n=1 Tax=Halomonas sp. NO4 TaxID=2484813 RepID=UPI0013D5714D|nr:methylenetetrahydrofolate reductase [Halomonas sp. NO4]